jgi:hypothetical protein
MEFSRKRYQSAFRTGADEFNHLAVGAFGTTEMAKLSNFTDEPPPAEPI